MVLPPMLVLLYPGGIVLLVQLLVALWTHRDATRRGMGVPLWPVVAFLVPLAGLVVYALARQDLKPRWVGRSLMAAFGVGLVLSGLGGALRGGAVYRECTSMTEACIPLELLILLLSGLYALVFLGVATPLLLLVARHLKGGKGEGIGSRAWQ